MELLGSVEFSKICRVCLFKNTELKPIFESSMDLIIQECTSLQVLFYIIN